MYTWSVGTVDISFQNYKGDKIFCGDTVAVAYNNTYYIGEVQKIHGDKREVEIKFMKRARNGYYSWPKKEDVDTVDVNFIFFSNVLLVGAGKERGGYVDCEEDIAELFDMYKNDYM